MKNAFTALLTAARRMRAGRPYSAALALYDAGLAKPKRKRQPTKVKSAKAALPRPKSSARPPRPAPGTFSRGELETAHGRIAFKLFTPEGSARRRMPMVVMLHGCGQSASDFAAGTDMNAVAQELGFIVLYPEQSMSANVNRCWNWHRPENQKRGKGEPAMIAALTQHAIAACRANPSRVYVAGISAGGCTADIVGTCYPELFAAVGVHSAVASGKVRSLTGAMAAMRTGSGVNASYKWARPRPTIVFHGDNDKVVHPTNAAGFLLNAKISKASSTSAQIDKGSGDGRDFTRKVYRNPAGGVLLEDWTIHGSGHAWSGGKRAGSFTDVRGPDASREMMRFFLAHRLGAETIRAKVRKA